MSDDAEAEKETFESCNCGCHDTYGLLQLVLPSTVCRSTLPKIRKATPSGSLPQSKRCQKQVWRKLQRLKHVIEMKFTKPLPQSVELLLTFGFPSLFLLCRKSGDNSGSRQIRNTPDWSDNAVAGDHLWVSTSVSGDCCYVGDNDCTVSSFTPFFCHLCMYEL